MLVVGLTGIEEVGIRGIHPPGIDAIVVEFPKILPIDIAGHRTKGIIDLHARGIILHGRPDVRDTALWPGLDGHQESFFVEFAELLCHRTEAGPDRDHEMGMLLVDILNQLRACGEVLREEVHGVPQIVGAPILPVLNDAVEGHLKGTVLIDDALRLRGRLITFLRLPEAVGPKREHGHIARQPAHLGDDAVGTAAIHKIVVDALARLRVEGHALGIVLEERG